MFEVMNMGSEVAGHGLSNVGQLTRHNWVLDHGGYGGCGWGDIDEETTGNWTFQQQEILTNKFLLWSSLHGTINL